jgi:hypothetical protein
MTAGAIERLALFFGTERTRQGMLARRALGRADEADVELTQRLRRELASGLKSDGTVAGGAVPTIWLSCSTWASPRTHRRSAGRSGGCSTCRIVPAPFMTAATGSATRGSCATTSSPGSSPPHHRGSGSRP